MDMAIRIKYCRRGKSGMGHDLPTALYARSPVITKKKT